VKIDFDIDSIRKNKIELLDCQVDLILRSLEFYSYTYQFIYPRRGKSESLESNLRICLVRDTYEQILNEFGISKSENPILHDDIIKTNIENKFDENLKNFKKIA